MLQRQACSLFGWCEFANIISGLRCIADQTGALLVLDEVMTEFRIADAGARERFDVTPDLTAHGQVIAPMGPVSQAGMLPGNPLAAPLVEGRRVVAATGNVPSPFEAGFMSVAHGDRE